MILITWLPLVHFADPLDEQNSEGNGGLDGALGPWYGFGAATRTIWQPVAVSSDGCSRPAAQHCR
jgi:hypothetical protein